MKTLAITLAAAVSLGTASSAFAADNFDYFFDAEVLSTNGSTITLDNGVVLDPSLERFLAPSAVQAGDTVRVDLGDDSHDITTVRVIG